MQKLLLVDYSNVVMRGLAVNQALQTENGLFTGGLYGFINMLSKTINLHKITNVVVCADAPPYRRIEEFGNYKGDREDKPNEDGKLSIRDLRKITFPLCNELMDTFKIPHVSIKGFEADDVIAKLADQCYDDFDEIFIMSNDSDLFQSLDDEKKIRILKKKGKDTNYEYTIDDFREDYGDISMEKFITLLALTGTHNNVPGIRGVGPATARKIMASNRKVEDLNEKHDGLVDRNKELIVLPHKDLHDIDIELDTATYSYRRLLNFLAKYEIALTEPMSDAFERLGDN